jgi:hypothetical protein
MESDVHVPVRTLTNLVQTAPSGLCGGDQSLTPAKPSRQWWPAYDHPEPKSVQSVERLGGWLAKRRNGEHRILLRAKAPSAPIKIAVSLPLSSLAHEDLLGRKSSSSRFFRHSFLLQIPHQQSLSCCTLAAARPTRVAILFRHWVGQAVSPTTSRTLSADVNDQPASPFSPVRNRKVEGQSVVLLLQSVDCNYCEKSSHAAAVAASAGLEHHVVVPFWEAAGLVWNERTSPIRGLQLPLQHSALGCIAI